MALRDRLVHLLTEAAEIEQKLLCSYLYAAFSLNLTPSTPDYETIGDFTMRFAPA